MLEERERSVPAAVRARAGVRPAAAGGALFARKRVSAVVRPERPIPGVRFHQGRATPASDAAHQRAHVLIVAKGPQFAIESGLSAACDLVEVPARFVIDEAV